MLKRADVIALVDWNAQIANAGQSKEKRALRRNEQTISYVTKALASLLSAFDKTQIFSVEMRVYHGWYMGLTQSDNRRAMAQIISEEGLPNVIENVSFDWSNIFGDTLMSAFDHRRHPKLKIHLPDTLREDLEEGGRKREKMVDAALICDLLCSARSSPKDWRIIMGEDDDLIPGVFVSERWTKNEGGKTFIFRKRAETGHLQLKGLVRVLEVYNA